MIGVEGRRNHAVCYAALAFIVEEDGSARAVESVVVPEAVGEGSGVACVEVVDRKLDGGGDGSEVFGRGEGFLFVLC